MFIDCTEFWSAEPEKLDQFFKSVTRLSNLTRLTVDDLCLTSLRPSLFVDAVINIYSVDLQCIVLTGEQLNMLFSNMNESSKLKELQLDGVDMSQVDIDILAAGVNKLKFADLYWTHLSIDQVTALLREAGKQTELTTLHLETDSIEEDVILHRVSGYTVEQEVVNQAKKKIKHMFLWPDMLFEESGFLPRFWSEYWYYSS